MESGHEGGATTHMMELMNETDILQSQEKDYIRLVGFRTRFESGQCCALKLMRRSRRKL